MELVVTAAIVILGVIFTGAFLSLVLICQHKNIRDKTSRYVKKLAKSDVSQFEDCLMESDVELGEVCLHPHIESILAQEWVGDATGLVSHCMAILKICHRLVNHVADVAVHPEHQNRLQDIIQVARRISIRADDMVRAMYPPLDARLLEARTVGLVLSVSHLTLVARVGTKPDWIQQSLAEMDTHLLVLREAALSQEAACRIQNVIA
ncbi:transmembrane protein 98-like [Macrosteles quadrilineatus]|uniref:transmembrane protein 98-like n=1 Tax=Macrosteles quadrilineatus TaxID=74068 RepID=UPI0023E23E1B|nr:transmembrane protein 98-like [Macrosteles quadrilineatus]XP_054271768.1 transmembrane protein 98-like [Macrosteles quadrilineatus]